MPRYDAVLFDLLTALIASWSLWNTVAGGEGPGRRWRAAYLRITYETGAYRPYEDLVADAATAAGLDRGLAHTLSDRYGELNPWPDVVPILHRLAAGGPEVGLLPQFFSLFGRGAVGRIDAAFTCVVTAEDAGYYKPDPRTYRLALGQLGVVPDRCLFVAGSA